MNTLNINIFAKRVYVSPTMEKIKLDNDISLQLASDPGTPDNGDEVYNTPLHFNNNPYKTMA